MKKLNVIVLALCFSLASFGIAGAEIIQKLHTHAQPIFVDQLINDATDAILGAAAPVIDLSGGDLDKCSFIVLTTSGTQADTMTLDLQISPDGGTNWVSAATQLTTVSTTTIEWSYQLANIDVSPGTKLRVIPTLSSGATFYEVNIWAMPSVD